MPKVTFDGANKLIVADPGVVTLDAAIDLYSDWKEFVVTGNAKFGEVFRTIGGDPIASGLFVGAYYFLQNQTNTLGVTGWRIRPHEADHELTINGNLYPEDAGSAMLVPTTGDWTVLINLEKSSLTQRTVEAGTDPNSLADAVWNEASASHTSAASFGGLLNDLSGSVVGGILQSGINLSSPPMHGMVLPKDGTANVDLYMISSSDHTTPATGVSPDILVSKNGGVFEDLGANVVVSEIGSGWYNMACTTGALDTAGPLIFHAIATGADAVSRVVEVDVKPDNVGGSVTAASSPTTTSCSTTLTESNADAWIESFIRFTTGPNAKLVREVTAYAVSNGVLTYNAFPVAPNEGDRFVMISS